jgi:branched-chain amino acid transport system substrate-binding protein
MASLYWVLANKRRLTLLGNQTLYAEETLQRGQVNASGMILPVPWRPEAIAGSSFPTSAQKMWKMPASWRSAMACDAALIIADALQFGSTRKQLQKTLLTPGFLAKGATGKIQFLATGDHNKKGTLVQVQPKPETATGFDFVAIETNNSTPSITGGGSFP